MKNKVKTGLLVIGFLAGLIVLLAGSFLYVTRFKYTEIDTQTSPDGRCRLILQMKGEPEWLFGSTYGRIIASYDEKVTGKISFEISDDGATLGKENWKLDWGLAGVQVTLRGSEQEDEIVEILYDGTEEFSGYSEEQIRTEMEKRYGNIRTCSRTGQFYSCDTGEFSFLVQNDLLMRDNYRMEYYRYLTDAYFAGRNRAHEYEEEGRGIEVVYVPVISMNSSSSEEKEWFCSDIVNWLLSVTEKLPYGENEELYQTVKVRYGAEVFDYQLPEMQDFSAENIAGVYNDLYDFVERMLAENYRKNKSEVGTEESENAGEGSRESAVPEISEEVLNFYLSLEPDCTWQTAEGIEYRMIPVDRALGSSYYALIATADNGKSVVMVNTNPYLGSGGGAKWISFLQDGQIGFSCLTYSAGTYGSLYRTEDGGRTFEQIEYPSAKVKLSDGTYYNPFVVPERVYEEDGKLYMEVGQGADGDYYGAEGFCNGLYESEDKGRTWEYVKEVAAER